MVGRRSSELHCSLAKTDLLRSEAQDGAEEQQQATMSIRYERGPFEGVEHVALLLDIDFCITLEDYVDS